MVELPQFFRLKFRTSHRKVFPIPRCRSVHLNLSIVDTLPDKGCRLCNGLHFS